MIDIADNDEITDIVIGNTPIEKAYLGSTLVWQKSIPMLEDADGNLYYVKDYINVGRRGGRYCSIGLYPGPTDYFETKMYLNGTGRHYNGAWGASNSNMYGVMCATNSIRIGYNNTSYGYKVSGGYSGKTFTFKTVYDDTNEIMNFYIYDGNNTLAYTNSVAKSGDAASRTFLIGNFNGSSYGAQNNDRVYYFKYWRNGELFRDLVPVQSVDTEEYCFFDKVNLKVYKSTGGSPFLGA